MRSRFVGLSVLLAACLAAVGCTAEQAASPPPKQTAVSTAGVEETAEPAVAVRAFDGDCAAALSEEEASNLLGAGAAVVPDDSEPADDADFGAERAAFAGAGGVRCSWQSPEGAYLDIAVLPLEVVTAARIADAAPTACTPLPQGGERCAIELSVSESWLVVSAPTADIVNGALAPIGSRLGDQHPEPTPAHTGEWAAAPCFASGQLVQLAVGSPGRAVDDRDAADPVRAVLAEDGRLVRCSYEDLGPGVDGLSWEAVSGVGEDDLALAGMAPADVAGLERAWTDPDRSVLVVQAGEASDTTAANTLVVRGRGSAAPAAMEKLAAALVASMPQRSEPAA